MICRTESLAGLPSEPQDPFTLRIVSSAQAYGLQTTFLDQEFLDLFHAN